LTGCVELSLGAVEAAITTTLDRRPAFMYAAGDNKGISPLDDNTTSMTTNCLTATACCAMA
jgi:hypothetical protein